MPTKYTLISGAVLIALGASGAANAHTHASQFIRIGKIEAAQECNLYEGFRSSSSSSTTAVASVRANRRSAAGYAAYDSHYFSSFETFFIKDCTSYFEGIKSALSAAIAASGVIKIGPSGYVLSGRIEEVVPVIESYSDSKVSSTGYHAARSYLKIVMNIVLSDSNGNSVFGAPIAIDLDATSLNSSAGSTSISHANSDDLYSILQNDLAAAAARAIAFHFSPLEVKAVVGRNLQLNHGNGLIKSGSIVSVTSLNGGYSARFRVSSTSNGSSLALPIGDADATRFATRSPVRLLEKDDLEARQGFFEKSVLP